MKRWVVDTNVAIVANGRTEPGAARPPSIACRMAAVQFMMRLVGRDGVLLDEAGAVQAEYRTYLNSRGQPGVGDLFYLKVLQDFAFAERRSLPLNADGEYADLPRALVDAGFDPSDRKFAALGRRYGTTVANAVDTDWVIHGSLIAEVGIVVENLCGCDREAWFETPSEPAAPRRRRR